MVLEGGLDDLEPTDLGPFEIVGDAVGIGGDPLGVLADVLADRLVEGRTGLERSDEFVEAVADGG